MKIYSHWTDDNAGGLKRSFFASEAIRDAHSAAAKRVGMKVLAKGEYTINNADELAAFLNKSCHVTTHDLAEEFAQENLDTPPTLEDMLS